MRAAQVERDVIVGPAVNVEAEGINELALVEVRRAEPLQHLVALADGLPVHLHILRGGAAEVHRDRRPAQHLLHGTIDNGGVTVDARLPQLLELLGVFSQRLQTSRHRVTRGVIAGADHQHEEVFELQVGEALAVDGGRQQRRDEVLAGALAAQLCLLLGVGVQLERGR